MSQTLSDGTHTTTIFQLDTGNWYVPGPEYKSFDPSARTSSDVLGMEEHTPANHLRCTFTLIESLNTYLGNTSSSLAA